MNNVNELDLQISNGGSALAKLGQRLIEYFIEDNKKEEVRKEEEIKKMQVHRENSSDGTGIIVKGSDNLLIRIARCCTPVPGDDIIGFITKGRGITVHRKDCSNIVSLPEREKGRLIHVEWETPKEGQTYYTDINICCQDRRGMFSDISKVCEDMDVRLVGVNMKPADMEYVNVTITVAITGTHQIQRLLIALRNVSGIDKVYRTKS